MKIATKLISAAFPLGLIASCAVLDAPIIEPEVRSVSEPIQAAIARYETNSKSEFGFKIVGGEPILIDRAPWQAALVVSYIADASHGVFCGGSVLNEEWILTAAHCVDGDGTEPSILNVVVGTDDLTEPDQRVNVKAIYKHEEYFSARYSGYDIALLKLATPIDAQSVELYSGDIDDLPKDTRLWISGFGKTEMNGKKSPVLLAASVPYVNTRSCNSRASYDDDVTDTMLCAGFKDGQIDSCQGDSGGPAVVVDGGTPYLAGVTSWGEGCALANKYGVYARVSALKSWVENTMRDN